VANITTTEVATAIAKIIAAQALGYLRGNTVAARIFNRDYENEIASYGNTVQVQVRGALSVNTKAPNTPVVLQSPALTKVDVILDQHKEVSFLIEDIARIMARPDLVPGYVSDAMGVLAETIDAFILGKYTGFSQTAIDASTTFDDSVFRSARLALNKSKVPASDRFAILSATAEDKFLNFTEVKNRDYAANPQANQAVVDGIPLSKFRGFNVVQSHQVVNTGTAPGKDHNVFAHRNAITLVSRPMPVVQAPGVAQVNMSEDGMAVRVTTSYNPDHLGFQTTVDTLYGAAILRASHGVDVQTAG
jgi:hypothetical protein